MGQEAKIGLGVIVTLVVVLAVSLAFRLTRAAPHLLSATASPAATPATGDTPTAMAAAEQDPAQSSNQTAAPPRARATAPAWNTAPAPWPAAAAEPSMVRTVVAEEPVASPIDPSWQEISLSSGPPARPEETIRQVSGHAPLAEARMHPAYTTPQPVALPAQGGQPYAAAPTDAAASPIPAGADQWTGVAAPAGQTLPADAAPVPLAPAPVGVAQPSAYVGQAVAPRYADPVAMTQARNMPDDAASMAGEALRPDGSYVVQPNDNYWRISEKCYGTGAYFKALAEHNLKQVPHPDRLQVGDIIEIPSADQLQANYGDLCPDTAHLLPRRDVTPVSYSAGGRTYVVKEGDTLFDIARWELKDPRRWKELYDLNRHQLSQDFDHLPPGTQLILPPDTPAGDVTARRPGEMQSY